MEGNEFHFLMKCFESVFSIFSCGHQDVGTSSLILMLVVMGWLWYISKVKACNYGVIHEVGPSNYICNLHYQGMGM